MCIKYFSFKYILFLYIYSNVRNSPIINQKHPSYQLIACNDFFTDTPKNSTRVNMFTSWYRPACQYNKIFIKSVNTICVTKLQLQKHSGYTIFTGAYNKYLILQVWLVLCNLVYKFKYRSKFLFSNRRWEYVLFKYM